MHSRIFRSYRPGRHQRWTRTQNFIHFNEQRTAQHVHHVNYISRFINIKIPTLQLFRFSKIDNPLDKYKNVQKCFNLMNTSEILYPNKLFTGTLTFNPLKPMEFVEVPIFVCNFIECMHPENVMKSIVIKISAKVFFSR